MSKKVLVTGASGLLGREIFNAFTGYDVRLGFSPPPVVSLAGGR